MSLRRRRPRRAKTAALQSLFKTIASPLPWPFLNPARESRGRKSAKQGEKPFQILLHFGAPAQKVSKLKSGRQPRPNAFKFPQFPPGISRFQSHLSNITGGRGTFFKKKAAVWRTRPKKPPTAAAELRRTTEIPAARPTRSARRPRRSPSTPDPARAREATRRTPPESANRQCGTARRSRPCRRIRRAWCC